MTAELVDCTLNEHSETPMQAKCLASFADVGKAQMDLMVMAFACDLSRVVSLQWSTAESTTTHQHLGMNLEHHRMSHDLGSNSGNLAMVDTWYAEQFAYLLSEMKKIEEGDGTLLDNTLLFWPNELSQGESHNRRDLPYVLAELGIDGVDYVVSSLPLAIMNQDRVARVLEVSRGSPWRAPAVLPTSPEPAGTRDGREIVRELDKLAA